MESIHKRFSRQNIKSKTLFVLLAVFPIVLSILPSDFFDQGSSVCLSRVLFDLECYACGLTRATMRLIHLDFKGAWEFNKLSFIVFPFISALWVKLLLKQLGINILKWF
jgi:hypothetical protein